MSTATRTLQINPALLAADDDDLTFYVAWIHLLFANADCVFVGWSGDDYAAHVCAAYAQADTNTYALCYECYGSWGGHENEIGRSGFRTWARDTLPTKLRWFDTLDALRAAVDDTFGNMPDPVSHVHIDLLHKPPLQCNTRLSTECSENACGGAYYHSSVPSP